MKINLSLNPDEAATICAALGFIRHNLTLNPDTLQWQFVGGGQFSCDVQTLFSLGYIETAIDEAREEAVNAHPFNPYIRTF